MQNTELGLLGSVHNLVSTKVPRNIPRPSPPASGHPRGCEQGTPGRRRRGRDSPCRRRRATGGVPGRGRDSPPEPAPPGPALPAATGGGPVGPGHPEKALLEGPVRGWGGGGSCPPVLSPGWAAGSRLRCRGGGGRSPAPRRGCRGAAPASCPRLSPGIPGPLPESPRNPPPPPGMGVPAEPPSRLQPCGRRQASEARLEEKENDHSLSLPDVLSEGNQSSPFHPAGSPGEHGALPCRGCLSSSTGGISSPNPRREAGEAMPDQGLALPRALVIQDPPAPCRQPLGAPRPCLAKATSPRFLHAPTRLLGLSPPLKRLDVLKHCPGGKVKDNQPRHGSMCNYRALPVSRSHRL